MENRYVLFHQINKVVATSQLLDADRKIAKFPHPTCIDAPFEDDPLDFHQRSPHTALSARDDGLCCFDTMQFRPVIAKNHNAL